MTDDIGRDLDQGELDSLATELRDYFQDVDARVETISDAAAHANLVRGGRRAAVDALVHELMDSRTRSVDEFDRAVRFAEAFVDGLSDPKMTIEERAVHTGHLLQRRGNFDREKVARISRILVDLLKLVDVEAVRVSEVEFDRVLMDMLFKQQDYIVVDVRAITAALHADAANIAADKLTPRDR